MKSFRMALALAVALAVGLLFGFPPAPQSEEKTIKIGLIFDFSGPFSAAGSLLNYRGAKLAIDWANDKGGVLGKYKIVRVDADAQSKADVAINEAERLLNAEHVEILSGIYSSAHAVPIAGAWTSKEISPITTAISVRVHDRNLSTPSAPGPGFPGALSFRTSPPSPRAIQKPAKDLRIAIIYETGPTARAWPPPADRRRRSRACRSP
jgi:branched-chain amino acid transport system substrate-binding protein